MIYVSDYDEIKILINKDNIYGKGPTTIIPFQSIVPLHLISLQIISTSNHANCGIE